MNLRSRFAWVRVAGLVSVLGLVACDSGSADSKDAKKAEPVKAVEPVKTAEPAKTEPAKTDPPPTTPPTDIKPADTAGDAKPADTAGDAKPADTAGDVKPADTKPADSKPADSKTDTKDPKAATTPKAPAIDGAPLYTAKCKVCHGADGKGTEAMKKNNIPDLTDKGWQGKHSKSVVVKAITDGIDGTKMKAFKDKFKPEEIDAIAAYVKKQK
jgi:mono/diheme cytochrome c family protein